MASEKDSYILGLCTYSHEASVALVKNGKVLFVIEQERLNREKHTSAFPRESIEEALKFAGISFAEISEVAFFMNPWKELTGNLGHVIRYLPRSLNLLRAKYGGGAEMGALQRVQACLSVGATIQKQFELATAPRVTFVEHHLAHASSCFHLSPFQEAAILTLDGRGESMTTLLAHGKDQQITKLQEVSVPHSLGHLYAALTAYLGFKPFHDEWKVMGMAAYGSRRFVEPFEALMNWSERDLFRLDLSFFDFHLYGTQKWLNERFFALFGPPRNPDGPLEQRHYDIAYALQYVIEAIGLKLAQTLKQRVPSDSLCLAGGVALNILMNRRLLDQAGFKKIFIQPLAHDAGAALGAATYRWFETGHESRLPVEFNPYLGGEFSEQEIEQCLRARGLSYLRPNELTAKAAELLSQGHIIGWFQGRMEAGPRALGNRSILADPRDIKMKDRLNRIIKKREPFRPFAPSVMETRVSEYFDLPEDIFSPYMLLAAQVRPEMRSLLPAIVHVDGSARPHTVKKAHNPLFWDLLSEFEKRSGHPVLINTSFNENEPIVYTPDHALDCYLRTELDAIVMGPFLVLKREV